MNASQLKKLYSSYTPIEDISSKDYDNFFWFETDKGKVGLSREEVTEREHTFLLELFPKAHPGEATREEQWRRLLFHQEEVTLTPPPKRYRFIFFTAEHQTEDQDTLHEAFQALFPFKVPILWRNSREGILIEEQSGRGEGAISFEEVMDVLMSDFYMKIRFYVSEFFHDFHSVQGQFSFAEKMAEIATRYVPGTFATPLDSAFYLYMDGVREERRDMLSSFILGEAREDTELLDTVKVFLEHGANVSATAKELYMHRNSLQYRIDKFSEVTGMDIKHFPTGVLVYLSILHVRT
ncbi:PucR family transcriptional regulator [Salimicrobium halophilum]|uniref:PucR C-terminal helix-turn-helix domain-containing protein n=1 Tax=Salimicrobium halophilum TaxID=86666 RepID=A0A1G8TP91_9BACI|nr:helix-turn-helix domain-containing protein [Salimicrobium halophilum]SDJ42735.1 PucR C-terminal helix-turn-helix domain-containing protein [Salimicrobium halophilum]